MRRIKSQKGITLIALIITIIVLLILAVVAIGAVTNDGIINYAKNARDEYGKAQDNEKTTLQNYLDKVKENIPTGTGASTGTGTGNGEETNAITFTIDDTEYTAEKGMTWKEWGVWEVRTLQGIDYEVIRHEEQSNWYIIYEGDYVDASSEIVEGRKYEIGYIYNQGNGTKINFTIDGTTYEAEEGMQWGAWLDSDYNTKWKDTYHIYSEGTICLESGTYALFNETDKVAVYFDQAIIDGREYTADR